MKSSQAYSLLRDRLKTILADASVQAGGFYAQLGAPAAAASFWNGVSTRCRSTVGARHHRAGYRSRLDRIGKGRIPLVR